LEEKASQNISRRENLLKTIKNLLSRSKIYLNGSEISNGAGDPKNRIQSAFQDLVKSTYPNLRMLNGIFDEDNIKSILLSGQDDLIKYNDEIISEAEMEIYNYIQRCKREAERTTVKRLINSFSGKPYGWYQSGILYTLAKLFVRGKVEIKHDADRLEKEEVVQNLSNNRFFENTFIESVEEYSECSIRELKNFHKDFFNESNNGKEPKEIALIFQERLREELKFLEMYLKQKSTFKFLKLLDDAYSIIQRIENKSFTYYLSSLKSFEDELLSTKEEIIDPIKKFMEGSQKTIYEDIASYLTASDANFSYINYERIGDLREVVNSEKPYKNNIIQRGRESLDIIRKMEQEKIREERAFAMKDIDAMIDKIKSNKDFTKLDDSKKNKILEPFNEIKSVLDNEKFIPVIINKKNHVRDRLYQDQLGMLHAYANPETKKDYISINIITPQYSKASL
jgi:hypothetical protein